MWLTSDRLLQLLRLVCALWTEASGQTAQPSGESRAGHRDQSKTAPDPVQLGGHACWARRSRHVAVE